MAKTKTAATTAPVAADPRLDDVLTLLKALPAETVQALRRQHETYEAAVRLGVIVEPAPEAAT